MQIMDKRIKRIVELLPGLAADEHFKLTSPSTSDYNCMSWANKWKNRWMWPNIDGHIPEPDEFWPDEVPHDEKPSTFIKAFRVLGFIDADDANLEQGYEKIALYKGAQGLVTHAARQLDNGMWTSKLSWWEDIQHGTPHSLEGELYGKVFCYMKRKL